METGRTRQVASKLSVPEGWSRGRGPSVPASMQASESKSKSKRQRSTKTKSPKQVVSWVRRQKGAPVPLCGDGAATQNGAAVKKKDAAAPTPTSRHTGTKTTKNKTMDDIRRCWTPQAKTVARRPEFNWQFYENECRILLTNNSSSALQSTAKKSTASERRASSAATVQISQTDNKAAATVQISSTDNKTTTSADASTNNNKSKSR